MADDVTSSLDSTAPPTRSVARTRVLLLVLLVLMPLAFRMTIRGLVVHGDRSPQRRALALTYFGDEDLERGRDYHTAFQPGAAAASLVWWSLTGWLVFGRFTRRFVDWAEDQAKGRLVLSLLLVGIPFFLLFRLALLPITVYHGFVLEGTFGFRRLDLLPWLWRLIKGWSVSGLTQVLMALAFFWIVRTLPRRWPWPVAILALVGSIGLVVLWPVVVLPLFYDVTPLPEGELRAGVVELAEGAGIDVADVRRIDQSRVSAHTNAFFVGLGSRRSIYLYDTLEERHTVPEILTVVGHEIGHWQGRHVLKGMALGMIGLVAGLFMLRWLSERRILLEVFRVRGLGDLAVIPLLALLPSAVGTITAPVENAVSRRFERAADEASFQLTRDPETFVQMQVTSARTNRADLLPHPFVVFWYSTHPPSLDRILAAESWRVPD